MCKLIAKLHPTCKGSWVERTFQWRNNLKAQAVQKIARPAAHTFKPLDPEVKARIIKAVRLQATSSHSSLDEPEDSDTRWKAMEDDHIELEQAEEGWHARAVHDFLFNQDEENG